MVQETLLRAHERVAQLRGNTEAELAGWLRRILLNQMMEELRKLTRREGGGAVEWSLEMALEQSSARLERWLASSGASPSDQAIRHEELLRLAEMLGKLPERQATALELKHLRGWSVEAISQHLGVSKTAVGGLLRRGMRELRERMEEHCGGSDDHHSRGE